MLKVVRSQLGLLNSSPSTCFIRSVLAPSCKSPSSYALFKSPVLCARQPARNAGHSHWKNIKHIKEAKDAEKQKVSLAVMQRMRVAVREGGGTNPKLNSILSRVIEDGKNKDVPMSSMTELLRKLEKAKEVKGSQLFVEAKGIDNCMLIIETYTDRPKWLRQNLQHILKKYGGTIGEAGTASHSFVLKGVVYVQIDETNKLTKDQALDAAIEAGAEDVVEGFDDYDHSSYLFICGPKETHSVKKALVAKSLPTGAARQEFIAHTHTQLDDAKLKTTSDMFDELEALDEVVRIFDNIESVKEHPV